MLGRGPCASAFCASDVLKLNYPYMKGRFRKSVIILLVLGTLCFAVYLFVRWILGPSKGFVTKISDSTRSDTTINTKPIQFSSDTLSFMHPADYVVKLHELDTDGKTKRIVLEGTGMLQKKIVLLVDRIDTLEYDDIPSVKYRRLAHDVYDEVPISIGGIEGLIFTKKEGLLERTAFLLRQGTVLSLSLSSPYNRKEILPDLDVVTSSLEWK